MQPWRGKKASTLPIEQKWPEIPADRFELPFTGSIITTLPVLKSILQSLYLSALTQIVFFCVWNSCCVFCVCVHVPYDCAYKVAVTSCCSPAVITFPWKQDLKRILWDEFPHTSWCCLAEAAAPAGRRSQGSGSMWLPPFTVKFQASRTKVVPCKPCVFQPPSHTNTYWDMRFRLQLGRINWHSPQVFYPQETVGVLKRSESI